MDQSTGMPRPETAAAQQDRPTRLGIIVLGMHRSGTSAIARAISFMGAALPRRVMGPGPGNSLGHWESERLQVFNDRLLARIGSCWDDWRPVNLARLTSAELNKTKLDLAQEIVAETGDEALFVLKDPRFSRLIGLYEEVLASIGIDARYVLALRNPLEVIDSLRARDGMTPAFAGLVWLRHVLEAERATRSATRAIVAYEDLLTDWRGSLRAIGKSLELDWPRGYVDAESDMRAFLVGTERHHHRPLPAVHAETDIGRWTGVAYRALTRMAEGGDADPECEILDEVRAEFDRWSDQFGDMMFAEMSAREDVLQDRLRVQELEREREKTAHRQLADEADRLGLHTSVVNEELRAARHVLVAMETENAELRSALVGEYIKTSNLKRDLEAGGGSLRELREQSDRELGDLRARLADVEGARADAAEGLSVERRARQGLDEEVLLLAGKLAALGETLLRQQGEHAVLAREHQELLREHGEMKTIAQEATAGKSAVEENAASQAKLLAELGDAVTALKAQLSARDAAQQDLMDEIEALEAEARLCARAAEGEIAECREARRRSEARLAEYEQSRSWRWTRPFRTLMTRLRGIRRG